MRGARLWLLGSIVMVLAALCQPWVVYILHREVHYVFSALRVMAVFSALMAMRLYQTNLPPIPRINSFGMKLTLLAILVAMATTQGLMRGNPTKQLFFDIYPYVLIYAFLVMGRHDKVWEHLEKPLLIAFWLSMVLVVVGLTKSKAETSAFGRLSYRANIEAVRGSVDTIGYRVRVMLNLWPLLFVLAYLKRGFGLWKILGLGTIIAYLALSVYFQKRAPLVRGMAYLSMIVVFIPMLRKKLYPANAAIMLVAIIIFFAAVSTGQSYRRLIQRFQTNIPLLESSRFREARALLNDLNTLEYTIGRGMGGYYAAPMLWTAGTRMIHGAPRNTSTHIGILTVLLKGGVLLVAVYLSFFVPMILRKPYGWYENRYNVSAMAIAPVYLAFQLIEGAPSTTNILDAILVGMAAARFATPVLQEYPEYQEYYEAYVHKDYEQYPAPQGDPYAYR
ncbi:MAG: hypothetical protein J7M14_01780 [Planctomycetes bacterium]|nr:hypothetical protein [Planctomycetota bacterium]